MPLIEVAPTLLQIIATMNKRWEGIANPVIPPEFAKWMFTSLESETLGIHQTRPHSKVKPVDEQMH